MVAALHEQRPMLDPGQGFCRPGEPRHEAGTGLAHDPVLAGRAGGRERRLIEPDTRPRTERVTRIELALSAWEADVLPLNYTRDNALTCGYDPIRPRP